MTLKEFVQKFLSSIVFSAGFIGETHTNQNLVTVLNLSISLFGHLILISAFVLLSYRGKITPDPHSSTNSNFVPVLYSLHTLLLFFIVIAIPLVDLLLSWLSFPMVNPYHVINPNQSLLSDLIYLILWLSLLVVVAPISEELIFRKALISQLEQRGLGTGVILIITSLLFALMHTPADLVYGSIRYSLVHFLGTFTSGFAFGFLYIWTRNVKWPIFLHSIQNGLAASLEIVISYFDLNEMSVQLIDDVLNIRINPILKLGVFSWLLLTLAFGFGVIIWIGKNFLNQREREVQPSYWIRLLTDFTIPQESGKILSLMLFFFLLIIAVIPILVELLFIPLSWSIIINGGIFLSLGWLIYEQT